MRVLFLTNVPSPYRVAFFNELGKNIDLTVLFERQNARCREKSWMDKNFKTFRYYFLKGLNFGNDGKISFGVKKYLSQEFDLVLLGNYHTITSIIAASYCIRNNIKYGLSIDGMFIGNDKNKPKGKIKRYLFSHADYFLTTGNYSVEVIGYYGGVRQRCFIYPFTSIYQIDILLSSISKEEKAHLRKELKITYNKVVLFVGQVIERKGIDVLLKAFKRLDDTTALYIIGGLPKRKYRKFIKKENIKNIFFIKFLDKESLNKYYLASNALALPTREDQWGLVVNEALAKGLPVVTTSKCLAAYELIKNKKTGYMVETNNERELAEGLRTILSLDEIEYEKYQENCLKTISRFTIEEMAKSHLEIFKTLLNNENYE